MLAEIRNLLFLLLQSSVRSWLPTCGLLTWNWRQMSTKVTVEYTSARIEGNTTYCRHRLRETSFLLGHFLTDRYEISCKIVNESYQGSILQVGDTEV